MEIVQMKNLPTILAVGGLGFLAVRNLGAAGGPTILDPGDQTVFSSLQAPGAAPATVKRWKPRIDQATRDRRVKATPRILYSIMWQESAGYPDAMGAAGEVGLMQILPSTAADFNFSRIDLDRPYCNILAGAVFFSWLLDQTDTTFNAVRAYNAGLTGSRRNPENGKDYAESVMRKFRS